MSCTSFKTQLTGDAAVSSCLTLSYIFKRKVLCLINAAVSVIKTDFFSCGTAAQRELWRRSFFRFLDHTRHNTVGRTPLEKWSACRRDLYLTTHKNLNKKTSWYRRDSKPQSQQAGDRKSTP